MNKKIITTLLMLNTAVFAAPHAKLEPPQHMTCKEMLSAPKAYQSVIRALSIGYITGRSSYRIGKRLFRDDAISQLSKKFDRFCKKNPNALLVDITEK